MAPPANAGDSGGRVSGERTPNFSPSRGGGPSKMVEGHARNDATPSGEENPFILSLSKDVSTTPPKVH